MVGKHFSAKLTIIKRNNPNAGEIVAEHSTYVPGGTNLFNHIEGRQARTSGLI